MVWKSMYNVVKMVRELSVLEAQTVLWIVWTRPPDWYEPLHWKSYTPVPIKANFQNGSFYSFITLIAKSTTFCGMLCNIFTKNYIYQLISWCSWYLVLNVVLSVGLSLGLKTVIKQLIMDGFLILRCLVKHFDVSL